MLNAVYRSFRSPGSPDELWVLISDALELAKSKPHSPKMAGVIRELEQAQLASWEVRRAWVRGNDQKAEAT